MLSHIQFISTPTADTPGTTLLLWFDNKRYLVGNVAEGAQRALTQMGAKMVKTSEIFITGRTEWSNVGGLLGMILTLADSIVSAAEWVNETTRAKKARKGQVLTKEEEVKPVMKIFGPPNITHMLATARRFIFRKGLPMLPFEIRDEEPKRDAQGVWKPTWEDENIKVWALAIKPEASAQDVTGTGSSSPSGRKRSIHEVYGDDGGTSTPETEAEREERYSQLRHGVVHSMFNSDWQLDQLIEQPLSEVKLPATLFVRNHETRQFEEYTGPLPGGDETVPEDIKVWARKPWPGALIRSLPPTKPAPEAISYVFCNHYQRGKFKPKVATELGVKQGQIRALIGGQAVQNSKGETITPDMVLEPGKVGGGVAVVDLPSEEYIAPLIQRSEWKSPDVMTGVGGFIWILAPGLASNPTLQNFMREMGHLNHIISSKDCCPNELAMTSAAAAQMRLNQVDPSRYPLPLYDNKEPQLADERVEATTIELPACAQIAHRGQSIRLNPDFRISKEVTQPVELAPVDKMQVSDATLQLAKEAYENIEVDQESLSAWRSKLPSPDAEVITLGTGSALPSKYRNVSATLVRVPGYGSYLLDAGENTLGQLKRLYSPSELHEVLKDLRMIWISHLHADHHLGTTTVIKAWYNANYPDLQRKPGKVDMTPGLDFNPDQLTSVRRLAVVSDTGMLDWLAEYSQVEDFGYSHIAPLYISSVVMGRENSKLHWAPSLATLGSLSKIPSSIYPALLGLKDIQAVSVNHCHGAKAVALTFANDFKVSYSGDCRPSNSFAAIGRGTTVLIHEATFDDLLAGEARAKQHSTTSEALGIAAAMRAKACVLTHFSQRYQKIPVMETIDPESLKALNANAPENSDAAVPSDEGMAGERKIKVMARDLKVCVAFDHMRVKVGDIAALEKFTPAL
ncbi:hypothetical protein NA57DRAFT_28567, partial [Rhizodiscina lignyota]